MVVPCARNVPGRPERIPRGFVAHKAPLQGRGLIPKGGCWGKRAARCLQPAETVAANIVRHGGSLREKRTGPAGTHPPRFCGARGTAAGRWIRGARGAGVRRTGPAFRGARCAPLQGAGSRRIRGGSAFCGARCAPLQGGGFAVHGVADSRRGRSCCIGIIRKNLLDSHELVGMFLII